MVIQYEELVRRVVPGISLGFCLLCCASPVLCAEKIWSTSTTDEFQAGTMTGTDTWSSPGSVQLGRDWIAGRRVNINASNSRDFPRLTSRLDGTGKGLFFVVWEDERTQDHYPDIYFNITLNSGLIWPPDKVISAVHVNDIRKKSPDVTFRDSDDSLWVVWQQDSGSSSNDGNIHYNSSTDNGQNWGVPAVLYNDTANQVKPRICQDESSAYLYTIWEDERNDAGDIYISRYDTSWGAPFKISDGSSAKEQQTPDIATDSSGNVFAVWHDARSNDDGDIYFSSWFSGSSWDAGNWSANSRLNDSSVDWARTNPSITSGSDNKLYVAWAERVPTGPATYNFQIVVASSSDSGSSWTNSVVHTLVSDGLSNYAAPSVDVDASGRLYVAWLHNTTQHATDGVILSAISPDQGTHWTEPYTVSGAAEDVKSTALPCLEYAGDGQLLVAWDDFRDATPDIYAAAFPVGDYLSSGEYTASFDSGRMSRWESISWTSTVPANTALSLASRVKSSSDAAWSSWISHGSSGETLSHDPARYIEYRASFTASDTTVTPVLEAVEILYNQTSWPLFIPAATGAGR